MFWFLFLPYGGGSLLSAICIESELGDPSEAVLIWAIAIFFLPWSLIVASILAHSPSASPTIRRRIVRAIAAAIMGVFAAGAGFGYIDLSNSLTGSSAPVDVKGPVVSTRTHSGSWAGTRRIVTIRFQDRDVAFSLSANEYGNVKVGDIYGQEMNLGGLGYYYRWGLAFWK